MFVDVVCAIVVAAGDREEDLAHKTVGMIQLVDDVGADSRLNGVIQKTDDRPTCYVFLSRLPCSLRTNPLRSLSYSGAAEKKYKTVCSKIKTTLILTTCCFYSSRGSVKENQNFRVQYASCGMRPAFWN